MKIKITKTSLKRALPLSLGLLILVSASNAWSDDFEKPPIQTETAEQAIHKIQSLADPELGRLAVSFRQHLEVFTIESILNYKARVPEADRVEIHARINDDAYVIIGTQSESVNKTKPEIVLFYKSNGKIYNRKWVITNEEDNDAKPNAWPGDVGGVYLMELGLHYFTDTNNEYNRDPNNPDRDTNFPKGLSRVTLEKKEIAGAPGEDPTIMGIVKVYSTSDTTKYLYLETNMKKEITLHKWVTISPID